MSLIVTDRPIGHKSNALTPAEDYPIVQAFGSFGTFQMYSGAATSAQGNIYFAPFVGDKVLKLIPKTKTYSFIGGTLTGTNKYQGLVRAQNGCLYGIPSAATTVLKIDPSTDTVTTFGSVAAGNLKYLGGVLVDNGNIYCIPYFATTILKIDPLTDTVSTFGSFTSPELGGGALSKNGSIYCAPESGITIFKIDTTTDTIGTIGSFNPSSKYVGTVPAYNDKFYGMPRDNVDTFGVLEIDPSDDSFKIIDANLSVDGMYGGRLAPNKKIYSFPIDNNRVLSFDTRTKLVGQIQITGPFETNKWAGSAMSHDGEIFSPPFNSNRILHLSRIGQVTPEMYTFPDDVSSISKSLYNKHMNYF